MQETEKELNLNCRFYENLYPQEDDLVVVQVKDMMDNGAYVELLEYNNIQGMITHGELSKQVKFRSVHKALKVGKTEVVLVLRVDQEKGYIDLSKKRVPTEKIRECEEKVAKGKTVNSLLRAVAEKVKIDIVELYEKIAWPLNKDTRFENNYEAFRQALTDPDKVFGPYNIKPEIRDKLYQEIKRRLSPQPVTVKSEFDLFCYTYEGIDGIKEALKAGEKKGTDNAPIKCTVISAPLYRLQTITHDKNLGIQVVNDALVEIENCIKAKNGKFEKKHEQPIVVGEKGEKNAVEEIDEHLEEDESDRSEDNEEDMGDADIGVDTEALDREAENRKEEDDDE